VCAISEKGHTQRGGGAEGAKLRAGRKVFPSCQKAIIFLNILVLCNERTYLDHCLGNDVGKAKLESHPGFLVIGDMFHIDKCRVAMQPMISLFDQLTFTLTESLDRIINSIYQTLSPLVDLAASNISLRRDV
jgi:hypothetical protein